MTEQLNALRDAVIAALDPGYDLVYVSYDDKLMDEQIAAVVRGDWDEVWNSNDEWEGESRHESAKYHAEQETATVIREWERRDERDYPDLWDEFLDTPQYDEVLEEIKDRDTSDPYKDLAHNSGRVLMRQVIAGEDESLYGNHSTHAVWRWLKDNSPEGTVLKRNKHNLDVIRSVINESMHSLGFSMGMLVYAVDVGDLYDMGDVEWVEVVNPYLYIGNYYQGDGWCSEEPLDAVFRIKRTDLRTDKDAPGYGWNEVAGVTTSAYECEVRAVAQEAATT